MHIIIFSLEPEAPEERYGANSKYRSLRLVLLWIYKYYMIIYA